MLELGDEAKLIFNDLIQVLPPWEEDFDQAFNKYNANEFKEENYYTGVFEELKKLGAEKVYFIKDTLKPELTISARSRAEKYLASLITNATFFEIAV